MSRDYTYSPIDWTLDHTKILYIDVSHIKTQKPLCRLLLVWDVIAITATPSMKKKHNRPKGRCSYIKIQRCYILIPCAFSWVLFHLQ